MNYSKPFLVHVDRVIRSDIPGDNKHINCGNHPAIANKQGAVAVVLEDGSLLGLKPGEFTYVTKPDDAPVICEACGGKGVIG